jgi:hypothetical protein
MDGVKIFIDVFNASEWELLSDGAWVRNVCTNEFILFDRFTKEAQAGIKWVHDHLDQHPIGVEAMDSLRLYLASVGD